MLIRTKFNGYAPDGVRLYNCDGGGSPAPAPTSQNVTQTSIPEYAKPYVEKMLGKAEALTEAPYQAYGGQRLAGFTPLQNQAFKTVGELGPTQQGQVGSLSVMFGNC